MSVVEALDGLTVPIVTPVTETNEVDLEGLEKIVDRVIAGGARTVFVLGGTGNFCSFNPTERTQIIRSVVEFVGGRAKIMAGCMDSSTRLVQEHVKSAASLGVDFAVVEPAYYYPCTDDEVVNHFESIAGVSSLPILIYNIPPANKTTIDINLTRRLSEIPTVVGIKDSTSDFVYWQQLVSEFRDDDFALIQGQETLAGPSMLLGGHGLILAIGNVFPRLCTELFQAARAGDAEKAYALQETLINAFSIVDYYSDGSPDLPYYGVTVGSFFAGLDAALRHLGVCNRVVTDPYRAFGAAEQQRVVNILEELQEWL